MAFNWVDFTILMLLILGLAVGYFQGLVRQVLTLAALYLGAILATQYFHVLANFVKGMMTTTPGVLINAVSFFVIMLVVMAILTFLAQDAARMSLRIPWFIDHIGGMATGLIGSWIIVTLVVNLLTFATNATSWGEVENVRLILARGLQESGVAHATGSTLPALIGAIRPWLPSGLPTIFDL